MFEPRIHENGNICCAAYNAATGEPMPSPSQCPKCDAHFATTTLRAAAANDATKGSYAPPDPYAAPLAKLRAELPSTRWPTPPVASTPTSGDYRAPDPYAADIAKLKENNR